MAKYDIYSLQNNLNKVKFKSSKIYYVIYSMGGNVFWLFIVYIDCFNPVIKIPEVECTLKPDMISRIKHYMWFLYCMHCIKMTIYS